ncbi:MAG: formylmethanofuran--tetrahydromethanopterin N-formyltransferase [Candidatus Methanomethylicota archaeon]|uniref:Formylmethanofuran--tetrahydromethanopterin formyltransferase n=1 Tax=Thermoproteota archaeon TaxID=2056631 RepID=A0A497F5P8_9CREN|nr:MAG: formylmethanofuran--tetrahydromethanopterin N-formyltransferase [Candidatus Verstraetearchaeota archaeon]
MIINGVEVEETFAEAFPMYATRILITAVNEKWALTAAQVATGFATSIIAAPAEAGVEGLVPPDETPDGRPGALIQIYHRSIPELKFQVLSRIGQCVLTCPTTAVFNGLPKAKRFITVGGPLSKFGDGFEVKDEIYGKTMWRIPVMEGEFLIEDKIGIVKAVAGGNLLILAESQSAGLEAAEKAIEAIKNSVKGVVMPFPGGIVRSGSKVGSLKYPKLIATTNHLFCPTLKDKVADTKVPPDVNSVYEIVINGLDAKRVLRAMGVAILAAASVKGVKKITAANYGGKLGKYKLYTTEAVNLVKSEQ